MFWIELLIAFLALYIDFAGMVIILHAFHKLYDMIRFHTFNSLVGFAFTFWVLTGVMFFILTVPLELILVGIVTLNPIIIAGEIMIALIIKKSEIADTKNI